MNADASGDEIRRFEEQYRRNPDGLVFARLADAYRKSGDPERALEILADGIRRHPEYPSGQLVRARTLSDLERWADAEAALLQVLELDPRNLVALRGLASLAERRGDAARAVHWLEQATIYEPSDAEVEADLERLRELVPHPGTEPVVDHEPLPAPEGDWWSTSAPEDDSPTDPEPPSSDPAAYGMVPGLDRTPDEPPRTGPEAVEAEVEEPAAVEDGEPEPVVDPDEPVPAAQSAGPNAWWFEDPDEAEPSEDGDLLTRTMAELYVKQGLLSEAAAIYRELLADRPEDEGLRAALATLESRVQEPEATEHAAREEPGETGPESAGEGGAGASAEARAAPSGSEQPPGPAAPDPYASHPIPGRSGASDVYREWLERLSG